MKATTYQVGFTYIAWVEVEASSEANALLTAEEVFGENASRILGRESEVSIVNMSSTPMYVEECEYSDPIVKVVK